MIFMKKFDGVSDHHAATNEEYNKFFIRAQQNYLNDLLYSRGHVFVNEAFDALGLPRALAGQTHGWAILQGHPVPRVDIQYMGGVIAFEAAHVLNLIPFEES